MEERYRGCLKTCGIGCGVLALGVVLLLLAVGFRTCVPVRSASRARGQLETRFGSPESFTPAPDGRIPAARIRAFLDVRRSLAENCRQIEAMQERMRRMDKLEEASGREVAGTFKGFGQVTLEIAPLIGEFFDQRNRALLDAEMGLGEYIYIFALSYRERFLDEAIHEELFAEGGALSPHAGAVLRSVLSRQLGALPADEETEETRRRIELEIHAMEKDPQRLPWQDGAPRPVEDSLAPFRRQLDDAFCLASAGIDMDGDPRRAMEIALE